MITSIDLDRPLDMLLCKVRHLILKLQNLGSRYFLHIQDMQIETFPQQIEDKAIFEKLYRPSICSIYRIMANSSFNQG